MRPGFVYFTVLVNAVIWLLTPDIVLFIELILNILGHLFQLVTVGLVLLRNVLHNIGRIQRRNHIAFLHHIADFNIDRSNRIRRSS